MHRSGRGGSPRRHRHDRPTRARRRRAPARMGPPRGSCHVSIRPTVRGRRRVLDPPLERPDRQRARGEVAGDDRAELLADEPDPEDVGLERLPGPREQGVVRPAAHGQGPAPLGQRLRPERGEDRGLPSPPGRRRTTRSRPPRPGRRRAGRPRGASGRRRHGASARCSPCRARRSGCRRTCRRRSSAGGPAGGRPPGRAGPSVAARRRPGCPATPRRRVGRGVVWLTCRPRSRPLLA